MTLETTRERLEWLRKAASTEGVDTIRVSWSDRLGAWRGKRLPIDLFLSEPERRIGFCDGMIVVDVNCDVVQATPFSNFETGYPDMYLRPRLETVQPVGWSESEAFVLGTLETHAGEPLGVAPRNALSAVVARLRAQGIQASVRLTLCGRLMRARGEPLALLPGGMGRTEKEPGVLRRAAEGLLRSAVAVSSIDATADGAFRLALAGQGLEEAADHAVVTKAAIKEIAREQGLDAVFMTMLPGTGGRSELKVGLELDGTDPPDPGRYLSAISTLRALLQPSVNAFKAGPISFPAVRQSGGRVSLSIDGVASEADPATALACMGAATGVALDTSLALSPVPPLTSLEGAAEVLASCEWAGDWLGDELVENSVPLLCHEARLFSVAVTDWELDRYWSAG